MNDKESSETRHRERLLVGKLKLDLQRPTIKRITGEVLEPASVQVVLADRRRKRNVIPLSWPCETFEELRDFAEDLQMEIGEILSTGLMVFEADAANLLKPRLPYDESEQAATQPAASTDRARQKTSHRRKK